jgi:uncharacterized DUF497 family protein
MEFEWDEAKAASNVIKHGITFVEAATVFGDPLAITFYDPDHSDNEDRFLTIGLSVNNRVVLVSHTDRGNVVRIISARVATKAERKGYEDGSYP